MTSFSEPFMIMVIESSEMSTIEKDIVPSVASRYNRDAKQIMIVDSLSLIVDLPSAPLRPLRENFRACES